MKLGESELGKRKTKILFITDDPWQKTGYGIVLRNILKYINKNEFEIAALGTQFKGSVIWANMDNPPKEKEKYEGWVNSSFKVLPSIQHPDGYDIFPSYIMSYKPDVVVTLRDVGIQAGFIPGIEQCRRQGWKGKWYGYCPIDSGTVVREWCNFFKAMDGVLAMSEWGALMIMEQTKMYGFPIEPITIPHGVDTEIYKPMKEKVQENLRKQGAPFSETFKVGAVGRNQYRKMWVYLLKGFAEFAKDKNDVSLVLHSDIKPVHPADGWSYDYISDKYGILNKVHMTFKNMNLFRRFHIDDYKMAEIFNSFDIFCLPTGGEGFGIPILEAQSCGTPVITTAFTTGFELVKGHGELIDIQKDKYGRNVMWIGQNGVEFAIPDDKSVAEKLEKMYKDWKDKKELWNKYSKESREHALKYDWKTKIVPLWEDLFRNKPTQFNANLTTNP